MIQGINVLSVDERKRQEESEVIASALRDATIEFMEYAEKHGVNVQHLQMNWEFNDGYHVINGGI